MHYTEAFYGLKTYFFYTKTLNLELNITLSAIDSPESVSSRIQPRYVTFE